VEEPVSIMIDLIVLNYIRIGIVGITGQPSSFLTAIT
jgi:hypothetical protein